MKLLIQQFYNQFKDFEDTVTKSKLNKKKMLNKTYLQAIDIILKEMVEKN